MTIKRDKLLIETIKIILIIIIMITTFKQQAQIKF